MASENPAAGTPLAERASFAEPKGKEVDTKPEESSGGVEDAQTDGAAYRTGASMLRDSEYTVNVQLSDLQADPNNPLYSIKSFEELGL